MPSYGDWTDTALSFMADDEWRVIITIPYFDGQAHMLGTSLWEWVTPATVKLVQVNIANTSVGIEWDPLGYVGIQPRSTEVPPWIDQTYRVFGVGGLSHGTLVVDEYDPVTFTFNVRMDSGAKLQRREVRYDDATGYVRHSRQIAYEDRLHIDVGAVVYSTWIEGGTTVSAADPLGTEAMSGMFLVHTDLDPHPEWTGGPGHFTGSGSPGMYTGDPFKCLTVQIQHKGSGLSWSGVNGYGHRLWVGADGGLLENIRTTGSSDALDYWVEWCRDEEYSTYSQGNMTSTSYFLDWSKVRVAYGYEAQESAYPTQSSVQFDNLLLNCGMAEPKTLADINASAFALNYIGGIETGTFPAVPPWDGQIRFSLAQDSAKALGIMTPADEYGIADLYLPVYVPWVNQADYSLAPFRYISVAHANNVDVDTCTGTRKSAWTGSAGVTVTNGGVGSLGTMTVTVPNSGLPYITRSLVSNFEDKIAWVIANASDGDCPEVYWYLKSGATVPTGYGAWPAEDLWNWTQHNYGKLTLTVPSGVIGTVNLELTYREITEVSDTHDPGRAAALAVTWSASKTATYSLTVAGSGGDEALVFCLTKANEGWYPVLTHIDAIKVSFPTSTLPKTWSLKSLTLVQDPGDAVHAEPATHAFAKFAEGHKYDTGGGGLSGNVDGSYQYALATYDSYKRWGSEEPMVPCTDWRFGYEAAWSLSAFLAHLNSLGNGFTFTLEAADWTAYTQDASANVVTPGYSFQFFDVIQHQLEPVVDGLPIAMRAYQWTPAPGILYTPYACMKVGGGVQGHIEYGLDWRRSTPSIVKLYSRIPTDDWELYFTGGTDEHGAFHTVMGPEYYLDDDLSVQKYEWGVGTTFVGEAYRRQWQSIIVEALAKGGVVVAMDALGMAWLGYAQGGTVYVMRRIGSTKSGTTYTGPQFDTPKALATGNYSPVVAVLPLGDGCLEVYAYNEGDGEVYCWYSANQGGSWTTKGVVT